jgi:hypothetical protein
MAATISINFATPEEVFSDTPPNKKSVSARVLNEVLGGGTVGGGYVQRNGQTPMTSYLTLFSGSPPVDQPFVAVHKKYVDDHAFTRRYIYTVGRSVSANAFNVFGPDDNGNRLYFFDPDDVVSNTAVDRYVDVYRNGILQMLGSDYSFAGVETPSELIFLSPPRVQFFTPLLSGGNVVIHIGNKGATPSVVGVASLSAAIGSGVRISNRYMPDVGTGELSISAWPFDFVATRQEVKQPNRNDVMMSPCNLSAFPLMPKAFGLFRKQVDPPYERNLAGDPYGSENGEFTLIKGFNMNGLCSGGESTRNPGDPTGVFTCYFNQGVYLPEDGERNYSPFIDIPVNVDVNDDVELIRGVVSPVVLANTKTLTGFKFFIPATYGIDPPSDVYEVSIVVY